MLQLNEIVVIHEEAEEHEASNVKKAEKSPSKLGTPNTPGEQDNELNK
jgi:hypothetical protein